MADKIQSITTEQTALADTQNGQTVPVRALKTFHRDGNLKGEMAHPGDEFPVDRSRAAQLRANGLIEYASESDDRAIHGEAASQAIGARVKLQAENTKIPENSKGSPLRNPEVKLAEVKDGKSSK